MDTPLLLIHFNRPDTTRQQLAVLARVRPTRVWVLCDGARPLHEGEAGRVTAVRQQLNNLPWKCEVATLYREYNLGVSQNISTGISWFLDQAGEGIILEDDCLPDPSFFAFASEMLDRYRSNSSVFTISGYTGKPSDLNIEASYCFSNYFSCWGWATWKRAWDCYDSEMLGFCDPDEWECIESRVHLTLRQRLYWKMIFDRVLRGQTDSWAYRMQLSIWKQRALGIIPRCNLVENIGFSSDAMNTAGLAAMQTDRASISFPLKHPDEIKSENDVDRWFEDHVHSKNMPVRFRWLMRKLKMSIL